MESRYTYRGKSIASGEWVYGYYVYDNISDRAFIYQPAYQGKSTGCVVEEVLPKTVGQCTGRKDIRGNWIYENDKVKDKTRGVGGEYIIKWRNTGWIGWSDEGDEYGPYTLNLYINDDNPKLLIIGNIHDGTK